eukprot:m.41479 g.41479  ORF g.41479 m.41479 type:complete len:602 (+) comp11463_c0_seq3:16-1821(+)
MAEKERVTEKCLEQSGGISEASPAGMVRILRQSDAMLFAGWHDHVAVSDPEMVQAMTALAASAAALIKATLSGDQRNLVVFSGCGTSGRMAWLCARSLNTVLRASGKSPCFRFLISGGEQSLVISNELPEDDPAAGVADLKAAAQGYDNVLLVGITCGLSAPYVAGQVDFAMQQPSYTTVVMGFNPVALARNKQVEGWDKTARQVFVEAERQSRLADTTTFVLNPVVGPEAITGSSRMKGGSITQVLLHSVFLSALGACGVCVDGDTVDGQDTADPVAAHKPKRSRVDDPPHPSPTHVVNQFAATYHQAYAPVRALAGLISVAGASLKKGGHLYYLGVDTAGLLGLVDISEMVDTYGCRLDEVRAFVSQGWGAFHNYEGDLSSNGPLFRLGLAEFAADALPSLTEKDCVIEVAIGDACIPQELLEKVAAKTVVHHVSVGDVRRPASRSRDGRGVSASISLGSCGPGDALAMFALKLILNGISTGANILKGSVVGNSMINLTVSNNKLLHRSADIVASLTGCDAAVAKECLIKAAHGVDALDAKLQAKPLSYHIEVATPKRFIVPKAVLLATGKYTWAQAAAALSSDEEISLRKLIQQAVEE